MQTLAPPPRPILQHDILNVFLGGMLGGSIVWGLRAVIEDPSEQRCVLPPARCRRGALPTLPVPPAQPGAPTAAQLSCGVRPPLWYSKPPPRVHVCRRILQHPRPGSPSLIQLLHVGSTPVLPLAAKLRMAPAPACQPAAAGRIVAALAAGVQPPGCYLLLACPATQRRPLLPWPPALPACSNYVSYRALAMATFRLFFPHAAVFGGILKWLHLVPSELAAGSNAMAAGSSTCSSCWPALIISWTAWCSCRGLTLQLWVGCQRSMLRPRPVAPRCPCPGCAEPKTERDKEAAGLPINCRYSRDLGVLQLTVFVVTFAYASEWWWWCVCVSVGVV